MDVRFLVAASASVLTARWPLVHPGTPREVRAYFDANFRWDAIGHRALRAYQNMVGQGPI